MPAHSIGRKLNNSEFDSTLLRASHHIYTDTLLQANALTQPTLKLIQYTKNMFKTIRIHLRYIHATIGWVSEKKNSYLCVSFKMIVFVILSRVPKDFGKK